MLKQKSPKYNKSNVILINGASYKIKTTSISKKLFMEIDNTLQYLKKYKK